MRYSFCLKSPKSPESLVFLILREGQQSKKISTGIIVNTKSWNTSENRMKRNHSDTSEVNHTLGLIGTETERLIFEARGNGRTQDTSSTFDYVKSNILKSGRLNRCEIRKPSDFVLEAFNLFIADKSKGYKKGSVGVLNATNSVLIEVLNPYTDFQKFLTVQVRDRVFALLGERYTNNTYIKHAKIIKRFLLWATDKKIIEGEDLLHLYATPNTITEAETVLFALTKSELQALEALELPEGSTLERVRDLFLLSAYTGLRYSDSIKLNENNLVGDTLRVIPQKTEGSNKAVSIPIHTRLRALLNKYPDWNFYKHSNQKANKNIKEVALLAGLNREVRDTKRKGSESITRVEPLHNLISWHCARRTYITLTLESNVTPSVTMKVSGHKTGKSFDRYIKHSDKHVHDEVTKAWG